MNLTSDATMIPALSTMIFAVGRSASVAALRASQITAHREGYKFKNQGRGPVNNPFNQSKDYIF